MSLSFLFLFLSFQLFADTVLEPIEVKASKDIKKFTFSTTHNISKHELETNTSGLLITSLERVPGIITSQNGGPGGRASFFIRGAESRHLAVTIDGMKINDTSNTDRQFDAAFLMSAFVKDITVHKGPQAVLHGSDALSGMIDLQTRKGEEAPESRLSINSGSFGTIDSALSSDWKNKKNNGTLTLSQFHTDGISRLNTKRFNAKEKDATDITQLVSSSEHRWAPKIQTDFLSSYLTGKAEQDGFESDNSSDFSRNDQYLFQQKTNVELSKVQAISLRSGFNRHQRNIKSLTLGEEFFNGSLIQNEFIHRLEFDHFELLSGTASDKEFAKTNTINRSSELHSIFLQSLFKFNRVKIHTGLRADRHSRYGSFYTGSGGLTVSDFSFQYSQGYKAPSLYQLFGDTRSNPNLVPETNHFLELGWRKETSLFDLGVSIFQNRLSNQFFYSYTKGYLNQQRFIAEGIELDGKLRVSDFFLFSSLTHQEFRNEQNTVLRRPLNSGIWGASYFPQETLEFNLTQRWFSARKDYGNLETVKLNSYEITEVGVKKIWKKDDFGIQIKNIFNREYEDIYGYSIMPRSLFIHYGHQF